MVISIKFVKTHQDAKLPERNHQDPLTGDACYDLFAVETVEIPPRSSKVVPIGLNLGYITPGYWIHFLNRSGNGFKKGLIVLAGIIDNGYRGPMGVKVYNSTDEPQTIKKGNGVAQFSIEEMRCAEIDWIESKEVKQSSRNKKGFGSSDK